MKSITLIVLFHSFGLESIGQKAKDLNIEHMLSGQIYAKSSMKDTAALGGFGSSENAPKKLNSTIAFSERGFFLKIDTNKIITIAQKFNGYNFYIVNKSDSLVKLDASDSRLFVMAEAFVNEKWQPIEYFPSSWCGNSHHNVFLKQNECWEFQIPKFKGSIPARIRYRLTIGKEKFIYSNEIQASINKKQLTEKQGHNPNGLMDPYNE